jgi:hypothetical protein
MTELTGEANATARVDAAAKTSVAIAPSIVLFIGIGFLIVPEVQSPWANLDHPSSGARHIDSPRDAVGCESQSALVSERQHWPTRLLRIPMTRNAPADRILDTEPVNTLARIVEEATRSTREGAKRFVEPAEGTLGRAKSRRHHIVFGRRGSGKSSLLTKAAAERRWTVARLSSWISKSSRDTPIRMS